MCLQSQRLKLYSWVIVAFGILISPTGSLVQLQLQQNWGGLKDMASDETLGTDNLLPKFSKVFCKDVETSNLWLLLKRLLKLHYYIIHSWKNRFASLIGRSKIRNAFSHSKIWYENLCIHMYKLNKLQHEKRFIWDFHTCWWSTRNLTRLISDTVLQQLVKILYASTFHEVISIYPPNKEKQN